MKKWRRGDSNPKRTETEPLQTPCNSATNPNARPLKRGSEKQNPDSSEHFETLSPHEFGANMVRGDGADSDLEVVVRAWPGLPADVKKQIKELIETSGQ